MDIAGRVSLLQQAFPNPKVSDLCEANAICREVLTNPTMEIVIHPIDPAKLRIGVSADASWGNVALQEDLEDDSNDYWSEDEDHFRRHHVTPRNTRFTPLMTLRGPNVHCLESNRHTRKKFADGSSQSVQDRWTDPVAEPKNLEGLGRAGQE